MKNWGWWGIVTQFRSEEEAKIVDTTSEMQQLKVSYQINIYLWPLFIMYIYGCIHLGTFYFLFGNLWLNIISVNICCINKVMNSCWHGTILISMDSMKNENCNILFYDGDYCFFPKSSFFNTSKKLYRYNFFWEKTTNEINNKKM